MKTKAIPPADWTKEPFRVQSYCETETFQIIYSDGTDGPLIDWIDEHGPEAGSFCGRGLVPAAEMPFWASREAKKKEGATR